MIIKKVFLNLFDGEGGSGATAATAAPDAAGQDSGDLSKVVYGKQPETKAATEPKAEVKTTSNTLEDKRKAYNDLINGEYKEFYTEDTQRIINKRFKETKSLESQIEKMNPLMEMLSQRYGESDPDKLVEKIGNDSKYWEDAAEEAGMTVDQYKEFKKLERENKALLKQRQQMNAEREANEKVAQWTQEEQALKQKFPTFELKSELQNPSFVNLLKAGVPMEHAFKVLHMDDIVNETMRTTAAQAEKAVTQNVMARGSRPQENGATSQSAFTVKNDVSKLTKKDRLEIVNRVKRGSVIEF